MKANWARGWTLGCLVACLGVTTAGCSDGGDPPPPTDLERGTLASTREDACGVESWKPLDVGEHLGILLSVFPGGHKRGVDCTLAAHNCQEVEACMAYYLADNDQYEAELEQLPKCDGEGDEYCEGNVAKFCKSDDSKTWYRASYDCTLAGATCVEQPSESGKQWANCQAPRLKCEGDQMSYCDGTRAVVCEDIGSDILSPWVYDCADAFGSHCVDLGAEVECEGPAVGEEQCDDGIDGDGDGKVDCMDRDCGCVEKQCNDAIDDDGDGKVDCDDSDCLHIAPCP
ncbi:MAG TPA: hypothetical protein VFK05_25565 [Polyangiaceae bacterium]|nr:hypothetical protein [Polyangiaceae bacterium]